MSPRPASSESTRASVAPPALVVLVAAGTALGALLALRDRLPSSPPLGEPDRWPTWWAGLDPLDALAGVVHPVLVAGAAYLCVVSLAALVARRRPGGAVARGVAAIAPRLLTATLVGTLVANPSTVAASSADDIWMEHLEVLDDAGTPTVSASGPVPQREPAPATLDPTPSRAADQAHDDTARLPTVAPDAHVVAPGEHLWGIAADTVAAATGSRAPRDVAPYWVALIEANRHRLVDPTNPDLIHPGLRLDLPMLPLGTERRAGTEPRPGADGTPLSADAPPPSAGGG